MTEQTMWNGEPCTATRVTVVVADSGAFPSYWAREHAGTRRNAVQVDYGGDTFYLDDEDGSGWHKVTHGGGPRHGHMGLEVEPGSVQARIHVDGAVLADNIVDASLPDQTVSIREGNGQPLVTVHFDGRLEFGSEYEPDAAARLFWEAIGRWGPGPMVREHGRPLAERINQHLARGQQAEEALDELRTLAEGWKSVMRPGEPHPAADSVLRVIGGAFQTAAPMVDVRGRCPACGWESLFLGDGGYVTCSRLECSTPDAASTLLTRDPQGRGDGYLHTAEQ
ncbi:hypothetical protein [Streptomyces sp. NPDC096153]|uniref:hypothetical protein n=1 Tax=Streptomyces sp. NPDC096153 TaxID=3155548 RepID=UPI00331F80A7